MPTVSVIIPTYNRADFVMEAIASVQAQTYQDWELNVVDDGSTDETVVRVQQVASRDRRLRFIAQPHRGNYAARNAGLRIAHGELIAFLDDDDRWLPTYLERQVQYLGEHPNTGAAFALARLMDATGRPLPAILSQRVEPTLRQLILEEEIWLPSQTMVRRTCLDRTGWFDDTLRSGADRQLWIRLMQQCPVEKIAEVLVEHRVHPGNISADRIRVLTNRIRAFNGLRPNPAAGLPAALLNARISQLHYRLARLHLQQSAVGHAIAHFWRAVTVNPGGR